MPSNKKCGYLCERVSPQLSTHKCYEFPREINSASDSRWWGGTSEDMLAFNSTESMSRLPARVFPASPALMLALLRSRMPRPIARIFDRAARKSRCPGRGCGARVERRLDARG